MHRRGRPNPGSAAGANRLAQRSRIVGVHAAQPVLGSPRPGGGGQAEHGTPSAREEALLAAEVPLPQPVIGGLGGEPGVNDGIDGLAQDVLEVP